MAETNQQNEVTEKFEIDKDEESAEIDEDSFDLKLDNLASTITRRREAVLSPTVARESLGGALSLPEIMEQHSRNLGISTNQFARAAANQGVDIAVLINGIGRQGREVDDVFKELKDKGTVAFKPLEERKTGMREIRRKRLVANRGAAINQLAQKRVVSFEKEFDFSREELADAAKVDPVNFRKISDPTKRQSFVAQTVYKMGTSAGLSQDQMAAILANGIAESRLDPMGKNQADGEDSHGVWQFNRSGSGEGAGFSVEQLQDPRFQMTKIIEAINSRDNLAGFRDPNADANELTKQFMLQFEKPAIQTDKKIRERQAYLGQANRLLEAAKKADPKTSDVLGLDLKKRKEVLDLLQNGARSRYRLLSDEDAAGGDVQNEVAQIGTYQREMYEREAAKLLDPKIAADPERAKVMAQTLAEFSGDGADNIRETFADSAFRKMMQAGLDYDTELIAKRLGLSVDEFKSRAGREGSKESKIAADLWKSNQRHAALYVTTNKIGVPAFVSYEFMDPENSMKQDRAGKDDGYWTRLFDAASKNRVQLVGLDANGRPVYRAENHLDSVFNKLNLHLSASSGALDRLLRGPEGESIVEALQEGSIEGVKNAQDFTKTLLSTDAARDSGYKAFALGSLGFLIDVLAPDPTFGFAKIASKSRQGIKKISPLINKKHVPAALESMGNSATQMVEAQTFLNKAEEAFASGNYEVGRKFLAQAKLRSAAAEGAEKSVRKKLPEVMKQVDRTDGRVALEIARDLPVIAGKGKEDLDKTLAFSDFGIRRDYVHPGIERPIARGESEGQLVAFPEFFDLSKKIDRLSEMTKKVESGDVASAYLRPVQEDAIARVEKALKRSLVNRKFSPVRTKAQEDSTTRAIKSMFDFMGSTEAADLLVKSPVEFTERLGQFVAQLPVKKVPSGKTILDEVSLIIPSNHRRAVKIKAASDKGVSDADLKQAVVDVTKSLAGIAEARGVSHALTRSALAAQEKVAVKPIIKAAATKYEEIGTDKISSTALSFRNQLEDAFPAMRGDAAMHVARNLDDRLKAIQRKTGEHVDMIYETRGFDKIIPNLRVKPGEAVETTVETAVDVATDPKFSKMAFGEELLTSREVRNFTRDISERLEREDMSDVLADLATQTVKQLKAIAKDRGIKGYSKLRKADLIERIADLDRDRLKVSEFWRRNPQLSQQHDELKVKMLDAQKDFQRKIDVYEDLKSAKAPTGRDYLDQPSSIVEAALNKGKDVSVIDIEGTKVRMFDRDKAEMDMVAAKVLRDRSIVELENFTRKAAQEGRESIDLADDIDFIPGMLIKIEKGALNVKSIELPAELQKKGIATSFYKIALQRAKKEGLDFASDVNPSPDAQRVYARLINDGLPIKKITSRSRDGSEAVQFIIGKDELARVSDDLLRPSKVRKPVEPGELSTFVADTQTVVRAMEEAPTVEEFILEISKVARRELDSDQMSSLTKWLSTKGIKVTHKGAVFEGDPEEVAKAEEAFAKSFAAYAKGRPAPTPETTSAFERVKKRVVSSFASAKNAQAEGARFSPSPKIEDVFDDLLLTEAPTRSTTPNVFKALKRFLLDDLPKKVGDEYLLRIAQESQRLGSPISVKELKKLVTEAAEKQAKNPDIEVTIDLPGPVSLGGLLSPKPKASYTLLEIGKGAASFAARKQLVENPATRKIALDSQVNAIRELSPSQMIDQYVKTSRPLARVVRSMYLGGDALDDMRDLPPKVREAIMSGVRVTQQSIGDTVTLISEGDASRLVRYITGDPQIKFNSGRNALSAGHDMMGSSVDSLAEYFALFSTKEGSPNFTHMTNLKRLFESPIGDKAAYSKALQQENIVKAFKALVYDPAGSTLLRDIFGAAGAKHSKSALTPDHLRMLKSIFDITDVNAVGTSADKFKKLRKDLDSMFPVKKYGDDPVANRVTVLIAGHGQASKARLEWVNLGIATDAKTATNFKRWVVGEALDNPEDYEAVRQVFQAQGYNPRFLEAADLEGLNFFVPAAARKKLSMALEQATDPELKGLSGDALEALGKGIRETQTGNQFAAAWTMRYLKTRMVRGHFILKSRYFWMNTYDHFNQMSQIVGFRPAFISTMRIIPQTFASNPVGQAVIFAAGKAGKDQAGEAAREVLQKGGDKAAEWAAQLTRASKWRGDLNAVLDGRQGFLGVDGVPHSYADLRRIGVEEGLSASFDTAELGTKIRGKMTMFLENEKKRAGLNKIPGAPTSREIVKITEDMAEGWSERERYGAMLTLVEMGVDPRKAARLSIDALYDYAGSMSKADRHWLVNIFLPFWAFQKNANRQLLDVVFSPRGAYRLGVLNRAYTKGTQLASELLYENMVDPLGIDVDSMSREEQATYDALKADLLNEYGVPIGRMPPALKRQIRMAFTGRDRILEDGRWYEISAKGLALRRKFGQKHKGYVGLLADFEVEKPSESSLPLFDTKRNAILVPWRMNESNKEFFKMMSRKDPNRTFSSYLLPEQSYIAAANHASLVTLSLFTILHKMTDPPYLIDRDDGSELFSVTKPIFEIIQPERAMLMSDLFATADLNKDAVPYKVAPLLAKLLDQMGYDVLPVNPKEDPFTKQLTHSAQMKAFEEGVGDLPEDPFLRGAQLEPTMNYYIDGGIGALLMKHGPVDELNGILKKFSKTPHENLGELRGELNRWIRTIGFVDVRDVDPRKTAAYEAYEQKKEAGGEYLDTKREMGARFIDVDDYEDGKGATKKPTPKKKVPVKSKQEKSDPMLEAYDAGRPVDLE